MEEGAVEEPAPGRFYGALNRYWMAKTFNHLRENPLRGMGFYLRKNLYLVSQEEIFSFESFEVQRNQSSLLSRLPPLGFGWIFPLALASLS
jgi:hypothetical protein